MKNRYLLLLVFISVVSLLLASFASMEHVEKLRSDDYSTYIHPGPTTTHLASSFSQQISGIPAMICHFIYLSNSRPSDSIAEDPVNLCFRGNIPIYLSYRQFLI